MVLIITGVFIHLLFNDVLSTTEHEDRRILAKYLTEEHDQCLSNTTPGPLPLTCQQNYSHTPWNVKLHELYSTMCPAQMKFTGHRRIFGLYRDCNGQFPGAKHTDTSYLDLVPSLCNKYWLLRHAPLGIKWTGHNSLSLTSNTYNLLWIGSIPRVERYAISLDRSLIHFRSKATVFSCNALPWLRTQQIILCLTSFTKLKFT